MRSEKIKNFGQFFYFGKEGCDLLNRWLLEGALARLGLWIIRLRS